MKKLLVLILSMVLLYSSASADVDLSSMSTEELLALSKRISLALFEKNALVDGVKVPAGHYIVGEDIPAGVYRIEYHGREDSFASFLASNEETWLGFTSLLGFSGASEIGKLELPEGTIVEVSAGDVYFYSYTGLFH